MFDLDVVLTGAEDQIVADAICQAIQDNPIVPTDEQADRLWAVALELRSEKNETTHAAKNLSIEFQRRYMFAPPEPEAPEDPLAGLIHRYGIEEDSCEMQIAREAYRRGKESK